MGSRQKKLYAVVLILCGFVVWLIEGDGTVLLFCVIFTSPYFKSSRKHKKVAAFRRKLESGNEKQAG